MSSQSKIEDYDPEHYKDDNPDFELPLLSELLGKVIEIQGVGFGEASRGTYGLVTVKQGTYRTSSEVLIDRLQKMKPKIDEGTKIRVLLDQTTTAKGTYHEFKAPE